MNVRNIGRQMNHLYNIWGEEYDNEMSHKCYMAKCIKDVSHCSDGGNINSHSVSRSKNFKCVNSWVKIENFNIFDTKTLDVKKISSRKLSTFRGLCGKHDSLFNTADLNLFSNPEDFITQYIYRQNIYHIYDANKKIYMNDRNIIFANHIYKFFKPEYLDKINFNVLYEKRRKFLYNSDLITNRNKEIESFINENESAIDLTFNHRKKFYFRSRELSENFEINISTGYYPRLMVNGESFKNKRDRAQAVYIFVLYNSGKPMLFMACEFDSKGLTKYIDDFMELKNIENIILRHLVLFENSFISDGFYESRISESDKKLIFDLSIIDSDTDYEIKIIMDDLRKKFSDDDDDLFLIFDWWQKAKYKRLSLSDGIDFKDN